MSPTVVIVATIAYYVFLLFFFLLMARLVVDLIRTFSRSWRPRGVGLVAVEAMYSITDPPVRFFRRILPPLTLGAISFDLGWSLTMFVCLIGMYIAGAFAV